jgi:hypothetical protein
MHHPFKVETYRRIGSIWKQTRPAHAANRELAVAIARERARRASECKDTTATVLYFRAVDDSWLPTDTALITNANGEVGTLSLQSPVWQQMGVPVQA